jgi:hypothetical protein
MAVLNELTSSNDNSGDIVAGGLLIKAIPKLPSGTLRTYSLSVDPAAADGGAAESMHGGKAAPASGDKTGSYSEVDEEEDEEEDEDTMTRRARARRRRRRWQRHGQSGAARRLSPRPLLGPRPVQRSRRGREGVRIRFARCHL